MSSEITMNNLKGGMTPDLDPSIKNESSYDYAENLRYVSTKYPDKFILHTVEGYDTWYYRSGEGERKVVGTCRVRQYMIIFTTVDKGTYSEDVVHLTDTSETTGSSDYTGVLTTLWEGKNLYCDYEDYADLEFLSCVGRYESDDNIKVYWATSYRPIRCYNALEYLWTIDGTSGSDYLDPDRFNLLPISQIEDNSVFPYSMVSGSLYSGTVFYTVSLLKDNLQESAVMPINRSGLPIYSDDINVEPSCDIKGDTESVETDKGVKVRVDIMDDDKDFYDKIRLYRIHYATYASTPTITIVGDSDISTEFVYDTGGEGDGEITLEEFSVITGLNYYAKTLTSKDNRLFAGNIKEGVFKVDFDARAYRFMLSSTSTLSAAIYEDYDDNTLDMTVTTSNWDSVPETANCVNLYNSLEYEFDSAYQYKYQSDGTTLGAEGPEVTVSFTTQSWEFDKYTYVNTPTLWGSDEDNTNPINASRIVAYQRGEVYRFGLVFYAEDGSESDVKWVCDLKIPGPYEDLGDDYEIVYTNTTGTATNRASLHPRFTLKNGLPEGAVGFRVVRAERTDDDRSVVTTGIYSISYDSSEYSNVLSFPANSTEVPIYTSTSDYNKKVLSFIDPETAFYQKTKIKSGDKLIIAGKYSNAITGTTGGRIYPDFGYNGHDTFANISYYRTLSLLDDSTDKYIYEIETAKYLESTDNYTDPKFFTLDSASNSILRSQTYMYVDNTYYSDTDTGHYGVNIGLPGRRTIIELDSDVETDNYCTSVDELAYAMIKREATGRYGGYDYSSRKNTTYINASGIYEDTNLSNMGDVYINNFDYLYSQVCDTSISSSDLSGDYFKSCVNIIFPVESPINLGIRGDEYNFAKVRNLDVGFLIRETAGTWSLNDDDYTLIQTSGLYLYDSVYSQHQTFGYAYPIEEEDYETKFDYRVIYSDQKFNDEAIDSWTKFKVNNFLDVNGNYGGITSLQNCNDQLYFLQESGFGALSVNQRSLITDGNAGSLSLGTGGTLSRYDYISTIHGLQDKNAVSVGNNTIYWFDRNYRDILSFNSSEGMQNLGTKQGISTTLQNISLRDNPIIFASDRTKEVYFDLDSSRTLVYDMSGGTFPSFLTFSFDYIFDDGSVVVYRASNDDDRYYVLYGDDSKYCIFNTTDSYQDAKLKVTCAKDYPAIKTFSHILLYNRERDSDYERANAIFNTAKFYNTYQYSEIDDLTTSDNIARLEKNYVISIPRNFIDLNDTNDIDVFDDTTYDTTRKFREKLRDSFMTVQFTYSPLGSGTGSSIKSEYSIPFVGFGYQKSIR